MHQNTQNDAWMWFTPKWLHLTPVTSGIFDRLPIMICPISVNIVKYKLEQTMLEEIKQ